MPRLSSITITGNEAANIADCLDSLQFCDERVVVDGGSKDNTVELAKQHGATVYFHQWTDHGTQKNLALSHAAGDWVLLLDADERVTPALAAQIIAAMENPIADGYEVPRLSTFCGREMWHSGWYPDYVLRLFRRHKGKFSDDLVHTRVICSGTVVRLTEPLRHYPVETIESALSRMDRYSTAGAEMIVASGRRVNFLTGIGHGLYTFIKTYILQAGFLDGREGLLLAVANAEGTFYKYMKAWLAGRRRG
jgi:glycosyltransferase involved in cell wall biosynthesis